MTTNDPWRNARRNQAQHPAKVELTGARQQNDYSSTPRNPLRQEQPSRELRLFGINACLAVFAHRPQAIRKIYITEGLIPRFRSVLFLCAEQRIGYRVVEHNDLVKLTHSEHHEGVCFEVLNRQTVSLDDLLQTLAEKSRSWLVWLDGVGNPHNFGAILRSAAHFGCDGLIMPNDSKLTLSGAACRVAEGGAESIPLAHINNTSKALVQLKQSGYLTVASVIRSGDNLFNTELPPKIVLLVGAESNGMSENLISACDLRLSIPGNGAVESLNVSAAFAVFAAQIAFMRR